MDGHLVRMGGELKKSFGLNICWQTTTWKIRKEMDEINMYLKGTYCEDGR